MKRDRGLGGDLKWALAILAGFALGCLVFGAEPSILLGAVIGVAVVVIARAVLRRHRARKI
jgi:hypothetical protein